MIDPVGGVIVAGEVEASTEIAFGVEDPEGSTKQLEENQGTTLTAHSHLAEKVAVCAEAEPISRLQAAISTERIKRGGGGGESFHELRGLGC